MQPRRREELRAGKTEHEDEADLQVAQPLEPVLEHDVERAQAEDREHVRAVEHEPVLGHRECRRDRVDREHDVRDLDRDQRDEQRRDQPAPADLDEEAMAMEHRRRREPAREPLERARLRDVPSWLSRELDRGDQQDRTEAVRHPVPARQRRGAGDDERRARDERTHDAPGEDAALLGPRDRECTEHHDEQEQVVDAERLLEQVRREPLLAELAAELEGDERAESDRHRDPRNAPRERALARIDVIAAMRDQIDRETNDQQDRQQGPRPCRHTD